MKNDLVSDVLAYNKELKTALQAIYDALNHGQRQKLIKNKVVKSLLDRYGVEYSE